MLRAYRVGERADRQGLEKKGIEKRFAQVEKEVEALKEHALTGNHECAARLGQLLFSLVRLGRLLDIHPENALSATVSRFLERYGHMENMLRARGQTLDDLSQEERATLWEDLSQSPKPEKEKSQGRPGQPEK